MKAKIAPLLRLQASDNDGERANASAAIKRLLQKHGLDWHDLVDTLLAEPSVNSEHVPNSPPPPSWKRSSGGIDLPRGQLLELLDLIEERSGFLSLKSREFLTSLRSRAWRPKVSLSPRQWSWLQDLLEDIGV